VSSDTERIKVYQHGFSSSVQTKTLEINYEPNPFPFVCAIRSLILAVKLDFWIGFRLANFIRKLMSTAPTSKLVEAQISHYGLIRSGENDINRWLGVLREQLDSGSSRVRLGTTSQLQLHLWRDWPERTDSEERAQSGQHS
jgi:hypothetical protein